MATKSVKRIQVTALRCSRRLKNKAQVPVESIEPAESAVEAQESDFNNQICMANEQQLKLKPEKESTSPPNHEGLVLSVTCEKARRVTRSLTHIAIRSSHEGDLQNDQHTPELNIIQKIQDQDTSKKFSKATSAPDCNDVQLSDTHLTNKKNATKTNELFHSPYTEFRKSYRKLHKRQIISIPYRKCHDALEGRIVAILNKLQSGKNCLRDFDGLMEKMMKISSKDLRNRFILSGIKTVIAVSEQKNIYDPKIIDRLRSEERKLQERLISELEAIDEYLYVQNVQNHAQSAEDFCEFKSLVLRKLYHYMRRHHPHQKRELKEKLFVQCEKFFEGEFNMKQMIKFIRSKIGGIH